MALVMLTIAAHPADDDHTYGHSKAEYFSSGRVEGTLILIAAINIIWAAAPRLWDPQPPEQVGLGLAVSAGASVVNLQTGKKYKSITS